MNAIRILISSFIVVLIGIATTGWIWTGRHQPAAQATASRVVLSLCVVAGIIGLTAIWRRGTSR
jgi:hypothetical protein